MSWLIRLLARLTGSTPAGEGAMLTLSSREYWTITLSEKADLYKFLREASRFFGEGSVIYFEGTSIAGNVREFLESVPAEATMPIATATYWPRPRTYHMALTKENMDALADLADHCAEPEVCEHLVVYRDGGITMEWWDVPSGAMVFDPGTPEATIAEICSAMQGSYEFTRNDD